MKLYLYLSIALVLNSFHSISSTPLPNKGNFTIEGAINAKAGWINLVPIGISASTDKLVFIDDTTSLIVNGIFRFTGFVEAPYGFYLQYFTGAQCTYTSPFFVVEKGYQRVTLDLSQPNPIVYNPTMQALYDSAPFKTLTRIQRDTKWFEYYADSLQTHYKGAIPDSLALVIEGIQTNLLERKRVSLWSTCSELNSSSYALWALYVHSTTHKFMPDYEYIFIGFSPQLRLSKIGKAVNDRLNANSPTSVGKSFPTSNYKNLKTNQFEPLQFTSQYTLIDFWFSGCGPCLSRIPELRTIYNRYSGRGFDLVGVATDRTTELPNLERVLKKYRFEWPEYLDENRMIASQIGIFVYPTYLLVDSTGHIVYKKISTSETGFAEMEEYICNQLK